MLALNISQSKVAHVAGLDKISELKVARLVSETIIINSDLEPAVSSKRNDTLCPLRIWSPTIEKLTFLKKDVDVKPVYKVLINEVNKNCYDEKLLEDPSLFVRGKKTVRYHIINT